MTSPFDIADWVIPYWKNYTDRITAVAIGIARGGDTNMPGGVFGQGGPAGDGPGQAAAAYAVWKDKGWSAFPERGSGRAALAWPYAAQAVTVRGAADAAKTTAAAVDNAATAVSAAGTGINDTLALAHFVTTPNAWVRIMKIGVGTGLVFIGASMISLGTVGTPFTRLIGKADEAVARQSTLSA